MVRAALSRILNPISSIFNSHSFVLLPDIQIFEFLLSSGVDWSLPKRHVYILTPESMNTLLHVYVCVCVFLCVCVHVFLCMRVCVCVSRAALYA